MLRRIATLFSSRSQPAPQTSDLSLRQRSQREGEEVRLYLNYEEEAQARQALELVDDYTLTSYERMITLWQQVRYLDRAGIPGCLVECGTWRGGACGMMALAHLHNQSPWRAIHLFDSFEGLPEPEAERDGGKAIQYAEGKASGSLQSIGRCVGTLEENQHLFAEIVKYPPELTHYHVGWFQQTVPQARSTLGPVALLRLDGDWYASTKICLDELAPLVSPGGFIILDDYGHWDGCRKATDEFLATLERPVFINHIDRFGRYLIMP